MKTVQEKLRDFFGWERWEKERVIRPKSKDFLYIDMRNQREHEFKHPRSYITDDGKLGIWRV
jgi:hypothetical protein